MEDQELSRDIYQMALDCGFDNCGIIPLTDLDGYEARLKEREKKIKTGMPVFILLHKLLKLKERYPWAKAAVICTEWYGKYQYPEELNGKYAKAFMLSRNSVPGEKIFQERVRFEKWMTQKGIRWEGGEANSPINLIPLREAAVQAGLGIIRKNNFFYGEKGSYYNLEGYLIDQECALKHNIQLKPCSDACNLCQKACKTKALSAPYTMNPMACVSFWTTFGKNIVPPLFKKEQFGDWICGCDSCQDACPHNRKQDWTKGEEFPGIKELTHLLVPANLLQTSNEELRERVIIKTVDHVKPGEVGTLRRGAKRVLENYE